MCFVSLLFKKLEFRCIYVHSAWPYQSLSCKEGLVLIVGAGGKPVEVPTHSISLTLYQFTAVNIIRYLLVNLGFLFCADHRGPPGDPMSTGEALIVRIGCGGVMFGLGGHHGSEISPLRSP